MSRLCLPKSLGLVVAAAFTLSFSPLARAQDFAGVVKTVPGTQARPRVLAPVDDSKLFTVSSGRAVPATKDLGRVASDKPMGLQLVLRRPLEQQQALNRFEQATHDPSKPTFGATLSPAEYAQRFGLAGSDLQALSGWLTSKGLTVDNIDNGRLTIDFRGTAAQVEDTFHTEIHTFAGADGSQHYANATELQIPRAVHTLFGGLHGIDNFKPETLQGFRGPVTDFAVSKSVKLAPTTDAPSVAPAVRLDGDSLHDASFTAARYSMIFGGSTQLNVRVGGDRYPVSGSLLIADEAGKPVAYVADVSACNAYHGSLGRSCDISYKPSFAGTSTLTATYSGDDHNRGAKQEVIIAHAGATPSYSVVTTTPVMFYVAQGSGAFTVTTVISYAGSVAPTGTYNITVYSDIDNTFTEEVAFTAINLSTCVATAADNLLTCTATTTDVALADAINSADGNFADTQFDVLYNGDTNYAASDGFTTNYYSTGAGTYTPSLTVQGSFTTAETYGTATPESGVTSFTEVPASGGSDPGYASRTADCFAFVNFTGPLQIGDLATYNGDICTSKTASCLASFTANDLEPAFTLPAVVTPGTYSITATYSGDTESAESATCNNNPVNSTTALSVTINKQTPVAKMTTAAYATPAPVTTQNAGALAPFTVYGTLAWTGVGVPPSKANVTFTSTAAGAFGAVTCTPPNGNTAILAQTPYDCSALFTPTSTDGAGTYNINLNFTTDINYGAVVSTTTGNYVINIALVTPTLALSPVPISSVYASKTTQAVTATLTGTATNGSTAGSTVTVTANATYGSLSTTAGATTGTASVTCTTVTTTSPASACTVYFVPNGTTNVGLYSGVFSATASAVGNYNAETTPATDSLNITLAPATLVLSDPTPGTTSLGVTSTTLTATLSPVVSGVSITFTDSTVSPVQTFTANTNSSGVATITLTTSTLGGFVPGGKNLITASESGTANISNATSNTLTLYLQGILFSTTGKHDFSGLITYNSQTVEGTVDGTSVGPYGVTIYNFTTATQALTLTPPTGDAAFTYTTTCGASLAAGANCDLEYTYAPPFGDGCSVGVGGSCTYDSAPSPGPYQQGTYEQVNWNVGVPSGILTGIGDSQFDRSGAVTLPGTLAGKAILATGTLSVTPTTTMSAPYDFGAQAPGVTSSTLTIIVTNSSADPVAFTYTPPATTEYQVASSSGAGNTCVSPLAGKSSCNIYVTFTGTIPATYPDSLSITPQGQSAITVYLTGQVESNSGITLTSNGHAFGSLTTGTTATFGLGVTNNSLVAQPISLVYSATTGYTVTNGCPASLPAGGNCSVTVKFAPTTVGSSQQLISIHSGTFIVPGGTTSSPYTDALTFTGSGVTGGKFTATSVGHNFGTVTVNDSAGNYGVQLANNTSSVISLSLGVGFVNGTNGFSVVGSSCGATLAVNASCELIFSFQPTVAGTFTAAYSINSNGTPLYFNGAVVSPEQISLSGTGN